MRLREGPLVSKCVITLSLGAACLTGRPSDLLHLLMSPGDCGKTKHLTAAGSLSNSSSVDDDTRVTLEGSPDANAARKRSTENTTGPGKKASVTHLWIVITVTRNIPIELAQCMCS